jgi:hypothetical protein
MAHRKSRAEAEMDVLLEKLDPSSDRYKVLRAARDFKAAWVQMGDELTRVREAETYREWGYPTFEAYCRRELRLKPDTANKLTRSFGYIRDHQPDVLEDGVVRELPPLDVVDLLSRARERTKLTENQLESISEDVFYPEAGAMPTKGEVLKRFREHDPDAFKSAPREKGSGEAELRKVLLLAERLTELVEGYDISKKAKEGVRAAADELKTMFEESRAAKSA